MSVHCTKCGEELLGAVNRCWKCGQAISVTSREQACSRTRDDPPGASAGSPAVTFDQPLQATLIDSPAIPLAPVAAPAYSQSRPLTTAELIDARRTGMMAMGGTVASLVLGFFAAALAFVWPLASLIAILGLMMGIWGLQSPKRNLALVGMLLCCLSIGVGTYSAVRRVYLSFKQSQPIQMPYDAGTTDADP
jgi:hypothetical protein